MLQTNLKFSKLNRLQTPADFQAVFKQPICSRSHYFTVLARPNQGEEPRLGIIVAKRIIKRAVKRNAIRRIIKESFRANKTVLAGLDIVVLVRGVLPKQKNTFFSEGFKEQWQDLIKQWKN